MALKDRMRKALGKTPPNSTRTSSSSSSNTSSTNLDLSNVLTVTPTSLPSITLTKTSSRLSKITSWGSRKYKEPKSKYPVVKNTKHQEMLRSFEMKFGRQERPSIDGRWSVFSGISPMASRNCSIDEGPRRRSSVMASLSRQASRDEGHVATVEEE